jgi:hypothetical protein
MNEVLVKTFSSSTQTIFTTVFIGIFSVLVSGHVSAKDSTNNSDTTHIDRTNSNNAAQTFNQKLSLQDVLAATMATQGRVDLLNRQQENDNDRSLVWLDSNPTLSLLYMHNQTQDADKEAQLSVVLPIKSKLKRDLDGLSTKSKLSLQGLAQQQQALYYSGLIRTLIWDNQETSVLVNAEQRKVAVLKELLAQYSQMAELNALPQYALFLLQKEVNDSQIANLEYTQKLAFTQKQYKQLTGLQTFPEQILEHSTVFNIHASFVDHAVDNTVLNNNIAKHPAIQLLDLEWLVINQGMQGQSQSAKSWQLQLAAKRIEGVNFSDNQIGVGVDIPITIGHELSTSQRNELSQAKLNYEVSRSQLLTNIRTDLHTQIAEYDFLLKKQHLLDKNRETLGKLEQSITTMLAANTQNQVVHIRNLIELFTAQTSISLNQLAINRQIAIINQAQGLSL